LQKLVFRRAVEIAAQKCACRGEFHFQLDAHAPLDMMHDDLPALRLITLMFKIKQLFLRLSILEPLFQLPLLIHQKYN
jgi:hypothetical protein